MKIFRYIGKTNKEWVLLSDSQDEDRFPTTIEKQKIVWSFMDVINTELDSVDNHIIEDIKKNGIHIPNPKIEFNEK